MKKDYILLLVVLVFGSSFAATGGGLAESLGKPVGEAATGNEGTVVREFENGTVVYNPMGNKPVEIAFIEIRKSAATGTFSERHKLACPDGDIYLKTEP